MQDIDSKKKILLVEDEAHLAFNLQFNMQAEGYDVIPAVNGIIALEKYESEGPFSAIVLDVNLPELNGFEVLKKIREKDSKTGIIMLTARASDNKLWQLWHPFARKVQIGLQHGIVGN